MNTDLQKISVMMLLALDALYTCRKTTLAAEQLGLAQPSLSVYLRQLRDLTGDALFVRTARGLEPTDFCHGYHARAREVLAGIEALSQPEAGFDPLASPATFSVGISLVMGRQFFDRLSVGVARQFPRVSVGMVYLGEAEALANLETGAADFFCGMTSEKLPKHFAARKLARTDLVVLCSRHSRFFKAGRITRRDYLATPHIKAATSFAPSHLDARFRRLGMLQEKLAIVPDEAAEIALLRATDYLLVIDRRDAALADAAKEFRALETDFTMPQFDMFCVWHARKNADARHRWFREYAVAACREA
ncbi:MAG TPA: LysR family transcriptional regulator [Patescibacteria group bacterium]|nr:LysR family transcriptional regulator [Patescibacteria group bacterium]